MLRASTLVPSVAHRRALSTSNSPPVSFKSPTHDFSNPSAAPKSIQTPRRLRSLSLYSPSPPRAAPIHLADAGSVATEAAAEESTAGDAVESVGLSVGVGNPSLPVRLGMYRMSLGDQAFFLSAFIACTTSIAFASLVIAAVPTLYAMKRAAMSFAKLADTAREELPSTMAAIRLSGMEISDLTLELSDLSQEVADGVSKSTQAVQAAEAGIRQIGTFARRQTMSMIEERASLPDISLRSAVGKATKSIVNLISRSEHNEPDDSKLSNQRPVGAAKLKQNS